MFISFDGPILEKHFQSKAKLRNCKPPPPHPNKIVEIQFDLLDLKHKASISKYINKLSSCNEYHQLKRQILVKFK